MPILNFSILLSVSYPNFASSKKNKNKFAEKIKRSNLMISFFLERDFKSLEKIIMFDAILEPTKFCTAKKRTMSF